MMLEHVVIVTDSLAIDGGSAKVALGSALGLARSGLTVTVFAAAGEASRELADCPNIRLISTGQGEALAARNRVAGALRGIWNRRAYARMRELLATLDRRRTVVHVHGWTKALSSSVIAAIVRSRFPVVITLHEYFSVCPNGCLYLHRDGRTCDLVPMSRACIGKNCDSRNYAFKLYRVARGFVQRTAGALPRRIAHYITVSNFSRNIIAPMLPPASRYYAVPNPVDAAPQPRAAAERNAPFLFIGRLSPEKGGVLLARAARLAGVRVHFIGEGPDRENIMLANPEARCLGWLDPQSVASQLRGARCIVVPSLWFETFGLVVREAAAAGIPAIVAAGTAPAELVQPGRTGLTFARGDVDDLAARLRACTDDATVERLSTAAYAEYWRNPATMAAHVDAVLQTYNAVLSAA
jgi:glycosyltransferase involved in cell wall biosynthesis